MPKATAVLDSFTTFGALLKYLRLRVRLTQTELAIAVGYGTAQISRLEQNQRLPDLTMLVALFVPALELGDEPEIVARLLDLAAEARGEPLSGRSVTVSHTVRHERIESAEVSPVQSATAAAPPPAHVPLASTRLIGRDPEVAEICERLLQPDIRLLTLIGPPGVGKTRLALEAAARLNAVFPDGALFVALAPIRDPALVAAAIAEVMGITETPDQPLTTHLPAALNKRHCLLVLDNVEHVLAARGLIADLLAAPHVRILLTSRAALHLSAEHQYVVRPLALPDLAHLPPLDELARYPSVALFCARARAVNHLFTLSTANALPVAAICVHLDGLPLALELAAARSKLLGPQALLTRLVHRFRLLMSGAHDLPLRHQTLKSALDWSYALLSSEEQQLFARLAVFVGGWRLEAAEWVAGARAGSQPREGGALPLEFADARAAVLEVQASLLDQSLLQQLPTADGEGRLTMLETMREYAMDQLVASDGVALAQQQHASYCLQLAEEAEPQLIGPDQLTWFGRLEEDHANLRAALTWAHQANAAEYGLRLAAALWRFWYEHGHLAEGRRWLEQALARDEGADGASTSTIRYRAKALNGAGVIAWRQGETARALALLEAGLALHEQVGDVRGMAHTLTNLGILASERGAYDEAQTLYERSLDLNQRLANDWGVAAALLNLGNLAIEQGAYERAVTLHEQALGLNRRSNDAVGIALSLNNLGVALLMQRSYDRAELLFGESLELHRALDDTLGMAYALTNLGMVAVKQHKRPVAAARFGASLRLSQTLGNKLCIAENLAGFATVACMDELSPSHAQRVVQLGGTVAAVRVTINAPFSRADQAEFDATLSAARHILSPEAFAAAWALGQAAVLEDAIAAALGVEEQQAA